MSELLPKSIKSYNLSICSSFQADTHTYSDKFGTVYKSVSSIVHSFFPFPRDIKVDPLKSKIACDYGTYMHDLCERYILGKEISKPQLLTYSTLFSYLESRKHEFIGSEVQLFLPELGICGTADILLNVDGKIVIGDFKTNKSLSYDNGIASYPLSELLVRNSTLDGYIYQLSVYAYILKATYGIIADRLEIWWIKPNTYEVKVFESPVRWDWVELSIPYFCIQPILQDTRETLPIPFDIPTEVIKLDEGDYTTNYLKDKYVCERKSPTDLYSSLIHNHERFRAEMLRCQNKNKEIEIFVECPKKTFISKSWGGKSYHLKTSIRTLAKIVDTFSERYKVNFVWCNDRTDMREKILNKLLERTNHYKKKGL
jgi:hypothetical protein